MAAKSDNRIWLNGDDGDGGTIDADVYSDTNHSAIKPSNGEIAGTYRFNKAGVGNANLVASVYLQAYSGKLLDFATCYDKDGNAVTLPVNPAGSDTGKIAFHFVDCSASKYRFFVDRTSGDGSGEIEGSL